MPIASLKTILRGRRSRKGNVAPIFALAVLPISLLMGFAVDMGRVQGNQGQVQHSLDAAVLSAAKEMQTTSDLAKIRKVGRDHFKSLLSVNGSPADCGEIQYKIDQKESTVEGTVECRVGMTVAAVGGMKDMTFTRSAKTAYGVGKLDVVFMFDTSGSMNGSRMRDLKKAAVEAVDIIFSSKTEEPDDVRIAIASYATSVNVKTDYFQKVTNQTPNHKECTQWKWKKRNGKWKKECTRQEFTRTTCVTGREGTNKYTDAAPGPGRWIEYKTTDCNSASIVPLTIKADVLKKEIDSLPATGATAGHLGIAWSWYLISPEWASIWPADAKPRAYDEPDTTKVAVLMTDGAFNRDYMSGGSSFDHAKKFCDAMRAKGVVVYTIAFKAPSSGEEILKYCGDGSGGFFNANSGQELTDAYKTIATNISDLRLAE